jgi:hypothetical protein
LRANPGVTFKRDFDLPREFYKESNIALYRRWQSMTPEMMLGPGDTQIVDKDI